LPDARLRLFAASRQRGDDKWAITELFGVGDRWSWAVATAGEHIYCAYVDGSGLTVAYLSQASALGAANWQRVLVDADAWGSIRGMIDLQGQPAVLYVGKRGWDVAYALISPPRRPEDWTITPVNMQGKNPSIAAIDGKPCVAYIDYSGKIGRLMIACAKTSAPRGRRDWRVSTVFAGWTGKPGDSARALAPAPPERGTLGWLLPFALVIVVLTAITVALVVFFRRRVRRD
jgi:hypothetical protein